MLKPEDLSGKPKPKISRYDPMYLALLEPIDRMIESMGGTPLYPAQPIEFQVMDLAMSKFLAEHGGKWPTVDVADPGQAQAPEAGSEVPPTEG
jgi:hypothetical protein